MRRRCAGAWVGVDVGWATSRRWLVFIHGIGTPRWSSRLSRKRSPFRPHVRRSRRAMTLAGRALSLAALEGTRHSSTAFVSSPWPHSRKRARVGHESRLRTDIRAMISAGRPFYSVNSVSLPVNSLCVPLLFGARDAGSQPALGLPPATATAAGETRRNGGCSSAASARRGSQGWEGLDALEAARSDRRKASQISSWNTVIVIVTTYHTPHHPPPSFTLTKWPLLSSTPRTLSGS